MALSAGRDGVLIAPQAAQDEVKAQTVNIHKMGRQVWPGLLRKLDRELPGYDC
jgi:hypothetical protein